ncbi:MAG: glycosyltransferase family 4 protein [Aphanocapsa lilacina HA4352-LM1]|jgi:glycosyltransferase involved in cell wall biosynthesis|nr:glycosyltransferase family 4 protein [Aphanocapsa lilacina HA4352-LM1]
MKIAVIGSKGLPAAQGGIERHCEEIYARLVRLGHAVDIYARATYTRPAAGGSYHCQGVRVFPLPGVPVKGVDALWTSAVGTLLACLRRYDIVHFHAVGPALFSALPRLLSPARVVVTCHGLDWQRSKWSRAASTLLHQGERNGVHFAHELIVVSQELQAYFAATYGRTPVYIPNAAASICESDPDFPFVASLGLCPGRYLLFVGRLVPEKRPDLLIEAFKALKPQGWKLVIVGGSSDTGAYAAELARLGEGGGVHFCGQLGGANLAEMIRGAGLFVLPSDLEGLPLVMLEAMQECVPVVASDLPVHQQLTYGGRGLLFAAGDAKACRNSLQWAIDHPQQLAAMARSARRYVRVHHDWDRIAEQTLQVYRTLLERARPDPIRLSVQTDSPSGLNK